MAITSFADILEKVGFRIANVSGEDYLVKIYGNTKIGRFADIAGQIATAQIANLAVTAAQIANGTITANELATDAVTAVKILAGAVTTAKIADSAVTPLKLAPLSRELIITGVGVSAGTDLTLTADTTIGTWPAVVSNHQEVPEAGKYRITTTMLITTTAVTAVTERLIQIFIGGLGSPAKYAAVGTRWTTNAADRFSLAPIVQVLTITNPATEWISLSPASGTIAVVIGSMASRVLIEKVN